MPIGKAGYLYIGAGNITWQTGPDLSLGRPRFYCQLADKVSMIGYIGMDEAGWSTPLLVTRLRHWDMFRISVILILISTHLSVLTRRKKRTPGLCAHCGYNLYGNVSGRCPECGAEIPSDAVTAVEHVL